MKKEKLSITFYVKNDKANNGEAPVYCKIRINSTESTFATQVWVNPKTWKQNRQLKLSQKHEDKLKREKLNQILTALEKSLGTLASLNYEVTANNIKNLHLNKLNVVNKERFGIISAFEEFNSNLQMKVDTGQRTAASMVKYHTILKHMKEHIRLKYNTDELYFDKVKPYFIDDFDSFLRYNKKISNNTTVKYVHGFRSIIKFSIRRQYFEKDIFNKYEEKVKVKKIEFLTDEELNSIRNKHFETHRMQEIRDIFLFGALTGYAYSDLKKLRWKDIIRRSDGKLWVMTTRTKTGIESNVPLTNEALKILDKYKNHPMCIDGNILPVKSNQKTNEYLKELGVLCGITKKMNCHLARHTFGTQCISKGISMESVKKMMGHSSIKQTEHYAKITDVKVSSEMHKMESNYLNSTAGFSVNPSLN